MRRTLVSTAIAATLALTVAALAPAAQAAVKVDVGKVTVAPAKADRKANVTVRATVTQQEYADISVDVTLTGFQATSVFPFSEGPCPTKLFQISSPADVVKCGWVQDGRNATLSIALAGTFATSDLRIKVRRSAVSTPAQAGSYPVTLSSWAFSPLSTKVTIR
jgi:hypothetical protein